MDDDISIEGRVLSGINGLDDLIEGGFPAGDTILLAGGTGSGKTIFSSQFISNGVVLYGEKGIYATLEEDRPSFIRNMKRFGFDFERLEAEGKVLVIDPSKIGGVGLDVNLQYMVSKADEMGATRLVIDSLPAFLSACEEKLEYRSAMHLMYELLKGHGYTTIMTVSIPTGSSSLGMGIEEFIADSVLQLESVIVDYEVKTRFLIRKMRGTDHSKKYHTVIFSDTGLEIVPFTTQ
ncbi:MAG: RAD55 family ATPase [Nitrososphaerales archaeon]